MDTTTYSKMIERAANLTELSATSISAGIHHIRILAFDRPERSRLEMVKALRKESNGGYSFPEALYLLMAAEIAGAIIVYRADECTSCITAS